MMIIHSDNSRGLLGTQKKITLYGKEVGNVASFGNAYM